MLSSWKNIYGKPRQCTKKQRHHFVDKCHKAINSQNYGFSSSHVWMWELDHKESWTPKNWCFWAVMLEKTLEGLLDCKEIHPVNPKGNQPWIFIGRTDAEVERPIFWPPAAKNWLVRKDPEPGEYWGQERWAAEGKILGWHHRLSGHEFEQAPGDSKGQRSTECGSPRGRRELDMTEWLKNNNKQIETQRR